MAIRGVFSNDVWVDEQGRVKKEFQLFFFYQNLFSRYYGPRPKTVGLIFLLSQRIRSILFRPLSLGKR